MQREFLVPIGDALSGMGGPVKAIREASPQALHTTDKLMADFLKYHEVPGLSKELPYPQKEVDKNQKPQPVGDHPPLRRIGNI